jgi:hypothetical protein
MNPSSLGYIAYAAIFEAILAAQQFNLPLTFLVLSTVDFIPAHVTEQMFTDITAKRGYVNQIITFFSYNPIGFKRHIRRIPVLRALFNFKRKPIHYRGGKGVQHIFLHCLKSVRGTFMPFLPSDVGTVLDKISHEIEVDFTSLKLGSLNLRIHKTVKNMIFRFPLNYDLPKFCPSLFDCLLDMKKKNIRPQPIFIDDEQHVKLNYSNQLDLTFTYDCPSCRNPTYQYNCMTQRCRNTAFEHEDYKQMSCSCVMCKSHCYKIQSMPY